LKRESRNKGERESKTNETSDSRAAWFVVRLLGEERKHAKHEKWKGGARLPALDEARREGLDTSILRTNRVEGVGEKENEGECGIESEEILLNRV